MDDEGLRGRCLCGGVEYTAHSPTASVVCHCKDCQRQSGSAFSVVTLFPTEHVAYRGTLSTFSDRGDTGLKVERLFCPICGSSVAARCEVLPGIDAIRSGTLDDTSAVRPIAQLYCDRQQPWVELPIADKFSLSVSPELLAGPQTDGLANG